MQVAINDIKIGSRREVDQKNVLKLSESIKAIGLQNPIVLTEDYTLVSGRHRLEAVKMLGHDLVEANILPLSSEEAELAEIDENLIRKDLSFLEQGQLIKRREEILDAMGLRAKSGSQPGNQKAIKNKSAPNVDLFKTTKDLADDLGLKETAIYDRKRVATNIAPGVQEAIIGTPLADKANQLKELAKKTPEQQKTIVEVITSGKAETVWEAENIADAPKKQEKPKAVIDEAATYEIVYANPEYRSGITPLRKLLSRYQIADNATLFLWATDKELEVALNLGKEWGFKYKGASFIWDKRYVTQGQYNEIVHAHLLIFVKGSHHPTQKKPTIGSIITREAPDFSKKPEVFKEIISELFDGIAILEV
ncbi:MAG: Site-specific DNA-methyltransferase (adenine-specific) [Vampirovibrio sp.]|jgi:hypothetical protein|nr:Site-specific DNA-methyltransferase (adenine-specific) [Vampirovibrio sp.]